MASKSNLKVLAPYIIICYGVGIAVSIIVFFTGEKNSPFINIGYATCTSERWYLSGEGWTFTAAAGWTVREGARPGDFEIKQRSHVTIFRS